MSQGFSFCLLALFICCFMFCRNFITVCKQLHTLFMTANLVVCLAGAMVHCIFNQPLQCAAASLGRDLVRAGARSDRRIIGGRRFPNARSYVSHVIFFLQVPCIVFLHIFAGTLARAPRGGSGIPEPPYRAATTQPQQPQ